MKSAELFIKGNRVINIGYRPFLLLKALEQGIQKIYAFNTRIDGKEMVTIRLQGEENILTQYINFIKSNYPDQAEVEEVIEREFNGPVEDAFKFAQFFNLSRLPMLYLLS